MSGKADRETVIRTIENHKQAFENAVRAKKESEIETFPLLLSTCHDQLYKLMTGKDFVATTTEPQHPEDLRASYFLLLKSFFQQANPSSQEQLHYIEATDPALQKWNKLVPKEKQPKTRQQKEREEKLKAKQAAAQA